MPAPPGQRIDRPFHEDLTTLFKGMLDMGAGAVRGVTRGTLGLPGDLESLVRLGIGGKQYLPTSEDWDKRLPPLTSLVENRKLKYGENPYDTMGQFFNLPVYGGTAKALGKGVKKFMGKEIPFDASRRGFGKKSAAIGGALLAAPLLKLAKHIDEAAPIAKQADEIAPVAKAAAKTHKFNSLKEYNNYLNKEAQKYVNNIEPNTVTQWKQSLAKKEEALYNEAKDLGGLRYEAKLNEFSPQAKAEMKAFKNYADEVRWDNAGGRMYEENPHMYNFPDQNTETLIEKYYEKDTGHWADFLDDYIKWEHDIPYPAKGSIDSMLGGSAAALGIRGLENSAGLKLVPSKSSTVKDPIQELLNSMLAEAKRDELYNYNKSGFKGTLEEWRKANTPEPQFAKTPVTNKEKQEAMWNSVQEAKRIMESENRGAPPHLRFFGERAKNDYERRLKEYLDLYGNVTPIK